MSDAAGHIPVLKDEIAGYLPEGDGLTLVDCTAGRGGHVEMMLEARPTARVIACDVDAGNLEFVGQRCRDHADRLTLVRANFAQIKEELAALDIDGVDFLLADLGISSSQLDDAERGLSFDREGPLDMRLDDRLRVTAADIVNSWPEGRLSDLFWNLAQEKHSRKIAKRICQARRQARINSTAGLSRIIESTSHPSGPRGAGRIHPATRVFMALRMEVNDEIGSLEKLLKNAPSILRPGGRFAIISFHSGEDRLVKTEYREMARAGTCQILTKKPMMASDGECAENPRSRSAKLRVAEKLPDA